MIHGCQMKKTPIKIHRLSYFLLHMLCIVTNDCTDYKIFLSSKYRILVISFLHLTHVGLHVWVSLMRQVNQNPCCTEIRVRAASPYQHSLVLRESRILLQNLQVRYVSTLALFGRKNSSYSQPESIFAGSINHMPE